MKQALFIALKLIRAKSKEYSISLPAIKMGSIAVGLGIMVMILTLFVIKGFKHQIVYKLKSLTSDVVVMAYQASQDISSQSIVLDSSILNALKKVQIVQDIEPVCIKNGILKIKEENEGVIFKGVSMSYNFDLLKSYLIEGDFPTYTDTAISKQVVISKKLADKMQIQLKQKIIIYFIIKTKDEMGNEKLDYRSRDFYVTAIIHPQLGELDNQLIYGDAKVIQRVNEWDKNEFSQIEIYGKEDVNSEKIVENIIDILPYNYRAVSAEELYSNIFNWLEMIDINAVIIIVLMLIVAAVNMVSALIILILEKVNLIGILKAMGMNNFNIKNVFLFISVKILTWGLLIGNLLAIIIVLLQKKYHLFKLNPDAYYISYIPVEWNWADWTLLNIGTILTCLIFMFIPTFLISRMSPTQILRWE